MGIEKLKKNWEWKLKMEILVLEIRLVLGLVASPSLFEFTLQLYYSHNNNHSWVCLNLLLWIIRFVIITFLFFFQTLVQ